MSTEFRRVVTGHNSEGLAVIRSDERFTPLPILDGDIESGLLWTTATVPADNNDEIDGRARNPGITIEKGSVIRVGDFLPGCCSPMHRTSSIDYGIVLWGHIELVLDSGEVKLIGPGDVVIQRGTNHLWRNPSQTETCRMVFVLIEAPAVRFDGQELPQTL